MRQRQARFGNSAVYRQQQRFRFQANFQLLQQVGQRAAWRQSNFQPIKRSGGSLLLEDGV